MTRLMEMLRCLVTGSCDVPRADTPTAQIAETRRLLKEAKAEWKPVIDRIEQERQADPELARRLRHVDLANRMSVGDAIEGLRRTETR